MRIVLEFVKIRGFSFQAEIEKLEYYVKLIAKSCIEMVYFQAISKGN